MPSSANMALLQGTLDVLILKVLALEPMHGYGIALRIEQISGGVFSVNPGSLFPALSRMERGGSSRKPTTGAASLLQWRGPWKFHRNFPCTG